MKIGIQTNVWLDERHQNGLPRLIAEVAEAGYDGFEIGLQRVNMADPLSLGRLAAAHGVVPMAIHTHGMPHDPDWVAGAMAYAETAVSVLNQLGVGYMPMSGKPKPGKTEADLQQTAVILEKIGRLCHQSGIRFLYHNHAWEIENDCRELRHLCDHTDPAHVSLLLDIGWVQRAGASVADVVAEFLPRAGYFHVKDTTGDAQWTELGKGMMDFSAFLAQIAGSQVEWLVVERDQALPHALASARESREYLRQHLSS